jgi:hypothetical protein
MLKQRIMWNCGNDNLCENSCKTTIKKAFEFFFKNTHVDDMMVHNFVKYLIQTRIRL